MCLETFITASNASGDERNFCTHVHVTPCKDFLIECEESHQDGTELDYMFCPNLDTHHAGIVKSCEELFQGECRKE